MAAAEMAQCTVEAIPTAMNEGMLISGIILAISFIGIFTETLHGFHRVKVAMLGAGTMVVGTDAPFIADRPGWTVDEAGLSPADTYAIRVGTAQTFLGMEPGRDYDD